LPFVRAVMQRSEQVNSYRVSIDYDDGRLKIDTLKHRVLIRNKQVKLTPVEFRLLIYLVGNADKVLAFDQILANVWGSLEGNNNYVHVYISHLRNKIEEDPKCPRYIQSIHGVGYIFEKQVTHPSFERDVGRILTEDKHTLETVQSNEY
jgi:DNA-binding response OmpR family regulator